MNLITGSVLASFSGAFGDLFDTFARYRPDRYIVINKEPIKTIVQSSPSDAYAGYSSTNVINDYVLTPVSGVFPAQMIYEYKTNELDVNNPELQVNIANNSVNIKVEANAKDFILAGKTESILVDGQLFNQASQYKVQDFLGVQYYYFKLTQTF